jgi:hypothetical protein
MNYPLFIPAQHILTPHHLPRILPPNIGVVISMPRTVLYEYVFESSGVIIMKMKARKKENDIDSDAIELFLTIDLYLEYPPASMHSSSLRLFLPPLGYLAAWTERRKEGRKEGRKFGRDS